MKEASPFQNLNLEPVPRVVQTPKGTKIRLRVITPFRFLMVDKFLMEPLISLWGILAAIYLLNLGAIKLEWGNLFNLLPFTQEAFLTVMAIALIIWAVERFGEYPLHKLLFGKNIRIGISEDNIVVWSGLSRSTFPRHRIAFVHYGVPGSMTSVYNRADCFSVVVDGSRKIVLAQIFGEKIVRNLVNNANIALQMPSEQSGRDIDPTRRQPA